ncbi:MAG: hypothetical protein RMK84_16370 [Oscillochloridaceae bacterium]|nr:hypothetical protein [Chloroflexaceae bacterium]MDW8391702.1 hypothetical protein [Oscillochloridaceae bacterium]
MSTIAEDVARLIPEVDEWPLLRGILVGFVLGAAAGGLVVLGQRLAERQVVRRYLPPPPPAPSPPTEGEGSPL